MLAIFISNIFAHHLSSCCIFQCPELSLSIARLEESQAAQKKLQEKLRKAQKEKAEKVLEEPVEKAMRATFFSWGGPGASLSSD